MIVTFCHYTTLERLCDAMSPVVRAGLEMNVARLMVRSAREVMPDAHIVMMTDEWTAPIKGVDEVIRRPRNFPMSMHRLEHWATCKYDEWVTVDTDVIFRAPLDDVFERPFDVALTRRTRGLKMPELPVQWYNIGVMFSRCPAFWQAALAHAQSLTYQWRELFMVDQLSVCATAPQFNVLDLATAEFNYKPGAPMDTGDARVLHYAGIERKQWMINRFRVS